MSINRGIHGSSPSLNTKTDPVMDFTFLLTGHVSYFSWCVKILWGFGGGPGPLGPPLAAPLVECVNKKPCKRRELGPTRGKSVSG